MTKEGVRMQFRSSAFYALDTLRTDERKEIGRILQEFSERPDEMIATGVAVWISEPQEMVELKGPNELRVYLEESTVHGWLVTDILRHVPVLK